MKLQSGLAAVVTGGASGLGEATARKLASAGVKVTLFDMNAEKGEAVAKDIGGLFAKVDVSDPASVTEGLKAARAAHGQERIAVNCAGIGGAAKTVDRDGNPLNPDHFMKIIKVNLFGTFNVASQAAAGMAAAEPVSEDGERGVIINTASVAAFEGQIGQLCYSASKGGVVGMTIPMARDLARSGIRVCTIAPGLFLTPLLMGLPEEARKSLGAQVPFPSRLGDPSEYAMTAAHICENPMLNGETIRLDGAIRMAPR
ncbi:NAD(P)-dependent dehydrogenase, short-chain alcohol dehydrogenase family [Albimonas donghaensis]|uniref:NAD(P)-dependent dehydrogenase, short-chain alcohol dehydrogenase family n=1 Tax=Albimonas donghaensis TaxID=356660 RepID=A0A1H3E6F1_9RHOB|nr:SDR family NAD(P)-dependent oxidoreductase [Albimonas donghaensis]SDX74322.1 NAD(P)-dependent dehydrogenase, short-chain alcohol dehydrogenase family [Albimonas donghaensis]